MRLNMTHKLLLGCGLVLLLGSGGWAWQPGGERKLVIVFTHDLHSHLAPVRATAGYNRAEIDSPWQTCYNVVAQAGGRASAQPARLAARLPARGNSEIGVWSRWCSIRCGCCAGTSVASDTSS
jgi:hypothetical protein